MSKPRCGDCRRKFKNESALAMHNRTVHPERKAAPTPRKRGGFLSIFLGTTLGVVVGGGLLLFGAQAFQVGASDVVKAVYVRR
jgi:hypothetical protein